MKIFLASLLIASTFLAVSAAPQEDLVNLASIPILNQYNNYTHNIYSGYLILSETKAHHYVFFESQNNPSTDPLILWLNGGPGCSSMLGMLYEHGPFVFPDGSAETVWNIYSWNTNASVIYMESPACVGFSYCNDQNMPFDDNSTAQDNVNALLEWFGKFPEYTSNDFYVMGESYGGVYVPFTSYVIDQYNSAGNTTQKINLKGYAVGNPVTNWDIEQFGDLFFWTDHGLISPADQANIKQNCWGDNPNVDYCNNLQNNLGNMLNDVNIYDAYRYCWQNNDDDEKRRMTGDYFNRFKRLYREQVYGESPLPGNEPDPGRPPCIDDIGAYQLLNDPQAREGFHIWANASVYDGHLWFMCSNINYTANPIASYWIYPHMISKGYKILVYSGDTDGSVPTEGTMRWIKTLASEIGMTIKKPYAQWTLPGLQPSQPQVAGYNVVYSGLTFVTVKGVGHMVPQWQRPAGYKMIYSFLNNQILT